MSAEPIQQAKEPPYEERLEASVEIERLRRIVEVMQLMDDRARLRTIKYLMSLYGCRYV